MCYSVGNCVQSREVLHDDRKIQNQSGVVPQFGLLNDIILYGEEPNIIFIFTVLDTLKYDAIFGAYELVSLSECICLYRTSIECYHPFNPVHMDSKNICQVKV